MFSCWDAVLRLLDVVMNWVDWMDEGVRRTSPLKEGAARWGRHLQKSKEAALPRVGCMELLQAHACFASYLLRRGSSRALGCRRT